jgi:hypothetical protein
MMEADEPFDLAMLRVSNVKMPIDDLPDTTGFFEQSLKDLVGDTKFKRAQQVIDTFKGGDIFFEKNEEKLLKLLRKEVFTQPEEESLAQDFIYQYASFKLMTQGLRSGNSASTFYFGIGETYQKQGVLFN